MIGTGIGLGLAGYRLNPPGVLPVLDLRFATDKSLTAFAGPTPSFSRASSGTYFDANGVLQSAGVNAARFNHVYNGTSWVSRGLLVEEQRTNLWLQSNNLNTAPWLKSNQNSTENAATSPDGTSNASNVVPNTVNAAHYTYQLITSSAIAYSISFYAKKNGYDFVQLSTGISTDYVNFNLNTGVVGNKTGGVYSAERIESVGNGWYRCSAAIAAIAGNYDHGICTINADTASRRPAFAGDGTSGILLYGFQMEAGSFATSLMPTTTASVTRSADVCQITGSDFSGFWNQSEGTFAAECDVSGFNASGVNYIGVASVGGISQYAFVGRFNGSLTALNFQVYNGSPFGDITYTAASATPTRTAFGMKANDCAASVNGGAVSTDNTVTMTTALNQLEIGNFLGANHLNGHIARLRYYPVRLSNSKLQELST